MDFEHSTLRSKSLGCVPAILRCKHLTNSEKPSTNSLLNMKWTNFCVLAHLKFGTTSSPSTSARWNRPRPLSRFLNLSNLSCLLGSEIHLNHLLLNAHESWKRLYPLLLSCRSTAPNPRCLYLYYKCDFREGQQAQKVASNRAVTCYCFMSELIITEAHNGGGYVDWSSPVTR